MWLILVDRSASMGEQFAGFNGVDRLPGDDNDRFSRLSVAVRQLAARGTGLHGAKLMFFTTPELNWPVIDVDRTLTVDAPDPVGVTDVAGALDWAHAQLLPLEASIDVHVLLITDLRTTPDTPQLHTAADALLRKATVHLILMDPNYLTMAMASEIAPARVLLAASLSGLASSLSGLFPGPPAIEAPPRSVATPPFPDGPSPAEVGSSYGTGSPVGAGARFEGGPRFEPPSRFDGAAQFGAPPRFEAPAVPAYASRMDGGPADQDGAGPGHDAEADHHDPAAGLDGGPDSADWGGAQWAAPEWTGENADADDSGREGGLVGRAIALGRTMKRVSASRLRK